MWRASKYRSPVVCLTQREAVIRINGDDTGRHPDLDAGALLTRRRRLVDRHNTGDTDNTAHTSFFLVKPHLRTCYVWAETRRALQIVKTI